MSQKQVKIKIQGIPPDWISYEVEGHGGDIVNLLYSSMRDEHQLYEIMKQSCYVYEQYMAESNNLKQEDNQ